MLVNPGGCARLAGVVLMLTGPAVARAQTPAAADIQALFQQGERALAQQRYADAARAYERLQQLQPGRAEVEARLGLIYFQQGRFGEAVGPLRRAVASKPAPANVDSLLAMSLSEIGRDEEAVPGLERGFRRRPADTVLRRMVGLHLQRSYTALGRDGKAAAVALEMSQLYPDDPEVLYHTGRILGNYAYLQTVRLARVAPDSVWLHQAAGEANESQGLLDEAIREYEQVLAMDPGRPGLHFRIGRVLLSRAAQAKGDPAAEAAAVKEFEQELQADPTHANAAYEIAELERKAGRLDRATTFFRRAVDAYPAFEEALVGLGRTLVAAGDAAAAVPLLNKAVALDPRDEIAFYQLAQAHRALGHETEQQQALAAFERLRDDQRRLPRAEPPGRPDVTRQAPDPSR